MLRYFPVVVTFLVYSSAQAQMSLADQINAVSVAQEAERARQQMLRNAAAESAAQAAAQQSTAAIAAEQRRTASRAVLEQKRVAAQVVIERQHAVAQKIAHDEAMADKERDQAYQDKLRALELQQRVQELKRIETRVSRENEYIDRDLRHQDAQTDVVQAEADATRNVSEGAKTFMQKVGAVTMKAANQPASGRSIEP